MDHAPGAENQHLADAERRRHDFPFRSEISNNTAVGYPVIVSRTVTAGMVILINADDFMSVRVTMPRFDVGDQATLHFEDTTPLQITDRRAGFRRCGIAEPLDVPNGFARASDDPADELGASSDRHRGVDTGVTW